MEAVSTATRAIRRPPMEGLQLENKTSHPTSPSCSAVAASLQFSPRQRRLGHLLFPFQDAGFFSDAWHPPDAALARTPQASMHAELAPCPAVLCAPSGLLPPRDGQCLPRATAGRSRRSQQCHWDAPTPCAVGDKGGVPDSRRQCGAPARPGSGAALTSLFSPIIICGTTVHPSSAFETKSTAQFVDTFRLWHFDTRPGPSDLRPPRITRRPRGGE